MASGSATRAIYSDRFWGKADRHTPGRIHLLEHHLADVGACFEALLAQPTIRRRLAHAGGREDLDNATAAQLCVFAALHDIGKVNTGFQARIWSDADLPLGRSRPGAAGHTLDLAPVLDDADSETAAWFFDALGWWNDLLTWDDRDGETVCGLFVAALSHHGRPLPLRGGPQRTPAIWRRFGALDPEDYTRRIGRLLRQWFPAAFASDAPPVPPAPEFQHHFLGLCNLADWIGSNERWLEYVADPRDDYIDAARQRAEQAVAGVGLNLRSQRAAFSEVADFPELFGIPGEPNAIQRAARNAPLTERLVIIESETGSGKTEAALWRFNPANMPNLASS